MKVTQSFHGPTYTFLYFVPNGIKQKQKQRTLQDKINERQFINKLNRNLHNKPKHIRRTPPIKIPRVKSMNLSEITL